MKQNSERVHILVVEDNPDDAIMTVRALKRLSPRPNIKLVRDGLEAIESLIGDGACYPELVFLDLKLPKVHGIDVLRRLREDSKVGKTPVVILTSSDDPKDIAKTRELGANDYIRKPIDWEEYAGLICQSAAKYLGSVACKV